MSNKIYMNLEEDNNRIREYFFVLGKNNKLSILEVLNYLKNNNLKIVNFRYNDEILIVKINSELELNYKDIVNDLGGIIKVGSIVADVSDLKPKNTSEFLSSYFSNFNRIFFGISFYNLNNSQNIFDIKKFGLEVKTELKNLDKSSRFVISNEYNLSSVTVTKNKLLHENGFEVVIIKNNSNYFIGRTFAVQDFEDYGNRDFGRPNRDSHSGMLPPKLCKMMINLTNGNKNNLILDPFCGSGTMLQELILLNYKNVIGTDLSTKAIEDSVVNISWLLNNKNIKFENKKINADNDKIKINHLIKFENNNLNIFNFDVRFLEEIFENNSIDTIIAEPYLGPNNINIKNEYQIKTVVKELEDLYKKAFSSFSKILKSKGEIVLIFPVFKFELNGKTSFIKLNILDDISKMQFKKINFNEFINVKENLNISVDNLNKDLQKNDFSNILYFRSDQRVYREIHKFIKI